MVVVLSVANRKGKKGDDFGAESATSFPVVESALLIARER